MEYNTLSWSKWWCQTETSHHAKEQLSKIYILSSYMVIYCLIKWRTKFPAHHEQQQQKCQSFTAIDNDSSYLCVCVCVCSVSQQPPKVSNGRLLPSSDANHRFACSRASTHSRLASKGAIGLKNLCAIFLRLVKAKNRFLFIAATFCCCCCLCKTDEEKENPILLHI